MTRNKSIHYHNMMWALKVYGLVSLHIVGVTLIVGLLKYCWGWIQCI